MDGPHRAVSMVGTAPVLPRYLLWARSPLSLSLEVSSNWHPYPPAQPCIIRVHPNEPPPRPSTCGCGVSRVSFPISAHLCYALALQGEGVGLL